MDQWDPATAKLSGVKWPQQFELIISRAKNTQGASAVDKGNPICSAILGCEGDGGLPPQRTAPWRVSDVMEEVGH